MSKAVVVIDMPKNCENCIAMIIGCVSRCVLTSKEIDQQEIINEEKMPDWCPIRPLPEKISEDEIKKIIADKQKMPTYREGKADGWNECLDAITGGVECE